MGEAFESGTSPSQNRTAASRPAGTLTRGFDGSLPRSLPGRPNYFRSVPTRAAPPFRTPNSAIRPS
jgi:hypothetical protein